MTPPLLVQLTVTSAYKRSFHSHQGNGKKWIHLSFIERSNTRS
jgi:hypothetical protein